MSLFPKPLTAETTLIVPKLTKLTPQIILLFTIYPLRLQSPIPAYIWSSDRTFCISTRFDNYVRENQPLIRKASHDTCFAPTPTQNRAFRREIHMYWLIMIDKNFYC